MVDHCDSGCCSTWFAGWEKTLESAETIPTAQEMPISHRASFISAPTWRVSYRATDSWLIVTQGNRGRAGYSIFDLGALQGGSARVDKLHAQARRAIESGEEKFRDAAEYLAEAQKLGASQRQNAKAIGMSPAWVNALLKWRRSGYRDRCPFPRSNRRVHPPCALWRSARQSGPTQRDLKSPLLMGGVTS